jgi:hypothetical protein
MRVAARHAFERAQVVIRIGVAWFDASKLRRRSALHAVWAVQLNLIELTRLRWPRGCLPSPWLPFWRERDRSLSHRRKAQGRCR